MFITPSPVFDASVSGGADNLGNLPEWDLNDLYQGTNDPKIDQDLAWLEAECTAFAANYEGKLVELNADDMLSCIQRNEKNFNSCRPHHVIRRIAVLSTDDRW